MNAMADKFFDSIKGKKVTFIGIGTSNLPLIKLFVEKGAKVTATVEKHGKGKKIVIFKYKPKKGSSHRRQGHRQPFTKCTIKSIEA